jgi:hypothetical protein
MLILSLKESARKKKKRVTVQVRKSIAFLRPHTPRQRRRRWRQLPKLAIKSYVSLALWNTKWRRPLKSYYPWPSETLSGEGARIQTRFLILNEFS